MRRKTSRAGELGAERLIERDAVKGAHQRAYELGDEDAVARMPSIARRQELDVGASDRADKLGHALGGGRRAAGIDDDDHLRLDQLSRGKDGTQGRVLPRQAVIRRDDAMERAQRVRRLNHVSFGERRVTNQVWRPVCRAAVGVDHDRAQAGEIAREALVHRADDVDDRRSVVQCRQSDQDVHLADGDQLPE